MPTATLERVFDKDSARFRAVKLSDHPKTIKCWSNDLFLTIEALEGKVVNYDTKLSKDGQWENLSNISAAAGQASAPKAAPASTTTTSGSANDRDTLIVDQVLFKGAIDLMGVQINDGNCITPEEAARLAIEAWERIRARHERPELVKAAVDLGGVVVEDGTYTVEVPEPDEEEEEV